ncbi:NHL repeat-containing protein [Nonlabens xiamenensis]|uniref:NHL repeat-containing protein n=1 Tax=Nonlabens xiamenensis TaxID=2341043 RepID=UPI001F0B920F|nr:NHL repeat-containing protein [Nonlabens xiamenensis]
MNMPLRYLSLVVLFFMGMVACEEKEEVATVWEHQENIELKGINPIGIALDGNDIFLSDGDHNRIVKLSSEGEILMEMEGYDRPMHIDFGEANMEISENMSISLLKERALFIPEYGKDSIAVTRDNRKSYLVLQDSLDAPAGVSVYNDELAIADFYTNRILYYNGNEWTSFGKEGKAMGDFYYPTDVQITDEYIYVADAYNNRGQVFDKTGKPLAAFGEDQNMNAATGIYVTDEEIFMTDFENDRIMVFGMDYQLKQVLETGVDKPTDMIASGDQLLITNYRKGELVRYKRKPLEKE